MTSNEKPQTIRTIVPTDKEGNTENWQWCGYLLVKGKHHLKYPSWPFLLSIWWSRGGICSINYFKKWSIEYPLLFLVAFKIPHLSLNPPAIWPWYFCEWSRLLRNSALAWTDIRLWHKRKVFIYLWPINFLNERLLPAPKKGQNCCTSRFYGTVPASVLKRARVCVRVCVCVCECNSKS